MLNAPLLTAAVDAFKIPDLRRKPVFTFGMLVASRSSHTYLSRGPT